MALKLGALSEERPVRVTLEIPAALHRDLVAYAEVHARENAAAAVAVDRLAIAMIDRFITSDRAFTRARHALAGDG